MEDLSLHILDIAENSIQADAKNIKISIMEDKNKDLLTLEISDDGKGMDEETLRNITNPFVKSQSSRKVRLGIAFLKESAEMANGSIEVKSKLGVGTQVIANFQLSHIDLKPLGNIAETIITLIIGNPNIRFQFIHQTDGSKFIFDTEDIIDQLNKMEFIEKISYLKKHLLINYH